MSGAAVEGLDLEGGLSNLSLQLAKVKRVKTTKLSSLRRTIKRFNADQDNLELWKALQLHKERADDCGDAYAILTETCMAKMREELETWTDKENESPMVARHEAARAELGAFTADRDKLDSDYFRLAGMFLERESSVVRSEPKPDTKKVKSADAIQPGPASLKLTLSEFQIWAGKATGWIQESNFMMLMFTSNIFT